MQLLSETAIKAIDIKCKNRLALELDRAVTTVERWLREAKEKNPDTDCGIMLTTAPALKIIREETGLTDEQILTQEPAQA